MNSPSEQVTDKARSAKSAVDSEVAAFDQDSAKSAQTAPAKVGIDAERIRSSIARLTSNSIEELEKLTTELQELQEFLRSETGRVQREIESVLAGIGIIIETIGPWKTADGPWKTADIARANGRDRIKRWP